MRPLSDYAIEVRLAVPRTIAAVQARLAAPRIPAEFGRYLDQVYAAREHGLSLDGQNVFVYRDAADSPGHVDVEFGVGVAAVFPPIGNVRPVELPLGEVATTAHLGPYSGLGAAHDAVIAWCRANARALAGPRWEVYGHWIGGDAVARTDVYYLLRPTG